MRWSRDKGCEAVDEPSCYFFTSVCDFTFHQEIYIHQCFFRVYLFYPSYRSAPQFPAQLSQEWRTCWKIVNIINCVQCHHLCCRNPVMCEVHLIFMQGTHQTVLTPRSSNIDVLSHPLMAHTDAKGYFVLQQYYTFSSLDVNPSTAYITLSLKVDKVHVDCKTWLLSSP